MRSFCAPFPEKLCVTVAEMNYRFWWFTRLTASEVLCESACKLRCI